MVRVNMFPIQGFPKTPVYFYDVTIDQHGQKKPDMPKPGQKGVVLKNPRKPEFNRRLVKALFDKFPEFKNFLIAYDGKSNFYVTKVLPFKEKSFEVEFLDEGESSPLMFTVTIKEATVILLNKLEEYVKSAGSDIPQDALTALDVFVTHHPAFKFTQRGHSLFSPHNARSLGEGIEVWGGYYSSVRPTKAGLMLNIDLASSSFYSARPVIELAADLWRVRSPDEMARRQVSDSDRRILEKALNKVLVLTHHQAEYKKRVRVNGLSRRSAEQTRFDLDGQEVSVADYFRTRYNVTLRCPNLPCIQGGSKNSLYPLEICTIVAGQYYPRKLNEQQTAEMIKHANVKPHERARKTDAAFEQAGFANNPFFRDLGIQQSNEMIKIKARTIDPPQLQYGNRTVDPRDGAWNLRDLAFKKTSAIANWAVMVVGEQRDCPQRNVENFVSELCRMAQRTGVQVDDRRPQIVYSRQQERDIHATVRGLDEEIRQRARDGQGLKFLLCMVRGSADVYASIKRVSDHHMGFVSQCMLMKHTFRINPQYLGNILMKINSKLGGGNAYLTQDLPLLNVPTMLVGADVTHPTGVGSRESRPSIVAMVGSLDRYLTRYTALVNTQPSRCEEIVSLQDMMKELLRRFKEIVGQFPKRIIFFRDGVSEGQFQTVFHREVRSIKAACLEISQEYAPPVTFLVVQKRHHIRFFPDQGTPTDRSGNVLPGTVIDTDIVHPREFDFYMMSHSGIQGTSRPVRYYCLLDENGFSSDNLQAFVYRLCYTNARCTRSTSLPPPVFYAHLVAYRGRLLSNVDLWGSDTESMSSAGGAGQPEGQRALLPLHQNLSVHRTMFFL